MIVFPGSIHSTRKIRVELGRCVVSKHLLNCRGWPPFAILLPPEWVGFIGHTTMASWNCGNLIFLFNGYTSLLGVEKRWNPYFLRSLAARGSGLSLGSSRIYCVILLAVLVSVNVLAEPFRSNWRTKYNIYLHRSEFLASKRPSSNFNSTTT